MWVMEEFSEESQEGEQNVPKGCEVAFYTWGTSQVSHSHSPVAAMWDRRERRDRTGSDDINVEDKSQVHGCSVRYSLDLKFPLIKS